MSGLSDYVAKNQLAYVTGQSPFPTAASVFLALFTAAPTSDAVTGGTEVTGGSYARVQVAGQLALSASFTTASTSLTLAATAPAWLLALGTNGSGVNVYDITNSQQIGVVSSISGTTVNLQAAALHASSGTTDTIAFSAFSVPAASSGTEPATAPANITNGASITFAQATASWGNVNSFVLYDAITSGNPLAWDYLGNFKWVPFSCSSATPGVLTTDASADVPANSSSIVVTQKYGGTLPTTGASWSGLLTTAGASTNTFNAGVNTTSVGGGQFRQVLVQNIAINVTASFAATTLTLTSA